MTYENHSPHIARHYTHAKEKHPYFADKLTLARPGTSRARLEICREFLKYAIERHNVSALEDVLECELAEVKREIGNGNASAVIEECYDAVAVLLRVVDVLRGEQKLGNPNNKESKK